MKNLFRFSGARLQVAAIGTVAAGLLLPGAALADPGTGTLVGNVTCGGGQNARAVTVAVEGAPVSASANGGHFVLSGVPAGQQFTVTAIAGDGTIASRYNVSVHPGETLDVGSLDLNACTAPESVVQAPEAPTDWTQYAMDAPTLAMDAGDAQ